MVPPPEESEDGNRASFPRWGKRSVISSHFMTCPPNLDTGKF